MNVRGTVRDLGFHSDEAAGDVTAIEDPIHGVSCKEVSDLLLGRKHNQRRLQEAGADHRRGIRLGHNS